MLWYLTRRVLSGISVVFITLLASFLIFFIAPVDPAGTVCGAKCPKERYAEIEHSLHLDRPVLEQFEDYVKGIFVGSEYTTGGVTTTCSAPCLGYSFTLNQPVTKLLTQAIPITVSIVFGGTVVYLTAGVLAGIFAARRRGTLLDKSIVGASLTLGSIPYFIVALVVALYATFLPRSEYHPFLENPVLWAGGLFAAWLTLGLYNTAAYTRYSRASMIESMGEDYIRTARAKGISERRVVYRHGLRAAMTPVITILGLDIAFQLTGAIFTETIFGLPGLGVLTLRAFNQSDLPVLMAGVLLGSVLLVLFNLIVDVVYTFLDPRVRLG